MNEIISTLQNGFVGLEIPRSLATVATHVVLIVLVALLAWVATIVTKRVILIVVQRVIEITTSTWDDVFVERKVFERASHLAPALVIHLLANLAFFGRDDLIQITKGAAMIYMVVVLVTVVDASLGAMQDIYARFDVAKRMPIAGLVQATKIVVYFLGGIFILSIVMGKSPIYFLSGLGALTAVLMLVFKDTILGFVGGIQLSLNNMVRVGDWIEMPAFGADGDVIDISLTSVKVQNWDKTVTTVPTYALVSNSFKNWRGMSESGGRRIKRAFNIDIGSIGFCDEEMLKRLSKIQLLDGYLARKKRDISEHNTTHDIAGGGSINGRSLTNIGTFRAYVVEYLKDNPKLHKDMTFLVRQLPIGDHGLPIEIYVFSNDQVWANYEAIQADIFDHLLAAAPEFGLRIFQNPTGADFRALSTTLG
jgi:miniconductance mechanosensitive channel